MVPPFVKLHVLNSGRLPPWQLTWSATVQLTTSLTLIQLDCYHSVLVEVHLKSSHTLGEKEIFQTFCWKTLDVITPPLFFNYRPWFPSENLEPTKESHVQDGYFFHTPDKKNIVFYYFFKAVSIFLLLNFLFLLAVLLVAFPLLKLVLVVWLLPLLLTLWCLFITLWCMLNMPHV